MEIFLVAQNVANLSFDVPMNARSTWEEVRRRMFARWPVTREFRCGMRGCRIGEATNPQDPT